MRERLICPPQTITADLLMTSLSLRGKLVQYLPDETEDTDDVTVMIDLMRGRVNLSVLSRERWLIVRFDGWPEVTTTVVDQQGDFSILRLN